MACGDATALPARPLASTELRQLWEGGRHASAIRWVLENWDELMGRDDDLHWLEGALRSCGLVAQAFAVQAKMTRRRNEVWVWERFIRSVLQSGDPWWARQLLEEVGADSRELQALRIEVALALLDDASELISAWVQQYRDEAALDCAVGWWVRSDRIEEAARLVEKSSGLAIWRARFALWRNDPDAARALLETLAPDPEVRCLEAIASVLEGDLEQAEAQLRPLLQTEVRAQAASWMATVLRRQRRYTEAIAAADAANMASPAFDLVARLERELAAEFERTGHALSGEPALPRWRRLFVRSTRRISEPRMRTINELEHGPMLYLLGLKPTDSILSLEKALEKFAGNHTSHLSTTSDGKLTSYPLPVDPRHLGAIVQLVLRTRGADAARALYRDLAPRVADHPLFRIYHGELELWMGAHEEAERIFKEILDRDKSVRWAWIGLGASLMFQGDLRQAQRIWDRGLSITRWPGPTLYVYRGECYRRQGELALARRELEAGLRQKPQRLSTRINLALLSESPEEIERIEQECVAYAPLLMEEISKVGDSPAERLEKVLEAMQGNRSSSEWHLTYRLWGHLWCWGR